MREKQALVSFFFFKENLHEIGYMQSVSLDDFGVIYIYIYIFTGMFINP